MVALVQVEFLDVQRLFQMWGLIQHTPEGIGDETAAPELHAAFPAGAVHTDNRHPVGHSVAPLYGLPSLVLFPVVVLVLPHVPADGCGEKQHLGTHQAGDTCSLGIPLVPAYQHTQCAISGLENLIAQVAGSEIELLVIARVVGYMHLAVLAKYEPSASITAVVLW